MAMPSAKTMPMIVARRDHGWWHATLPSGRPVTSPSDARIRQEASKEGTSVRFIDSRKGGAK